MKIDGFDGKFLNDDKKTNREAASKHGPAISVSYRAGSDPADLIEQIFSGFMDGLDGVMGDASISVSSTPPKDLDKDAMIENIIQSIQAMDNKTLKIASKALTEELKRRGLI